MNAVGADKNVLVRTSTYSYDTECWDGLWDYSYEDANTYLARIGYTATGYWGTETNGGILVDEDTPFASCQALAEALGTTLENGNVTVNVYAQWALNTCFIQYNSGMNGVDNPTSQTKTFNVDI